MQFSSSQDLDKQHYYHPLPDSRLQNERSERKWRKKVIKSETPKHKSDQQEGAGHRRGHFNKYALAAAILASTNSVLLGYGELF